MIRRILTYYAASLDEYLHHKFQQPEGMAEVGIIGSGASEKPCEKLIVSLVNIERETAGGISAGISRNSSDYMRTFAPLLLNLDLMLAAVYDETIRRVAFRIVRIVTFYSVASLFLNWMGRNIR